MCQTPFESHGLSYIIRPVGTARSPSLVIHLKGLRHIDYLIARSHTLLHGESVEERLDGTSHLTLSLTDIVVFEILV